MNESQNKTNYFISVFCGTAINTNGKCVQFVESDFVFVLSFVKLSKQQLSTRVS